MGEGQQPGSGKAKSSLPQFSAMHIVIIIGVIVIAAIFVARFGFGTDIISPSSGEMAITKQRITVTPARTIDPTFVRPDRTLVATPCNNTMNDPNNCGVCGNVCSVASFQKNVAEYGCSNGKYTIKSCQIGYPDCTITPATSAAPAGEITSASGGQNNSHATEDIHLSYENHSMVL